MKKTFREAADARLAGLTVDRPLRARIEAGLPRGAARPRLKPHLALALASLLMAMLAAAFALTDGFGLLRVLQLAEEGRAPISPRARELVVSELASHRFAHTEVAIREALYDGRMLRVLYSVRDLNADAPFGPAGATIGPDFTFPAADSDGISWQTLDACDIDGETACATGVTGTVAGERDGEVLTISQFDLSQVPVGNPFRVLLPLAGRHTPDSLAFTLPSDPLPGVVALPPQAPLQLPDRTLQVSRVVWSPIRVYIDLDITMAAGVPEPVCHETLWHWTMDAQLRDPLTGQGYALADTASGYTGNAEFAPDVGDFRHRILDAAQPVTMRVHLEFAAPDQMPARVLLSAGEEMLPLVTVPQP